MNKLFWLILISDIVIFVTSLVTFFVGTAFHNFTAMWAGVILFVISLALLIIFFLLRTWLKAREEKKNKISRD